MATLPTRSTGRTAVPVAALTLIQPWGHAIAHLGKRIENRGWAVGYPIDRLLIHAGATLNRHDLAWLRRQGYDVPDTPTASAIIAVTSLLGVCSVTVNRPGETCGCGGWATAEDHHWQLGDVRVLDKPVPCSGRLGLWMPPADVLAAVEEAIR